MGASVYAYQATTPCCRRFLAIDNRPPWSGVGPDERGRCQQSGRTYESVFHPRAPGLSPRPYCDDRTSHRRLLESALGNRSYLTLGVANGDVVRLMMSSRQLLLKRKVSHRKTLGYMTVLSHAFAVRSQANFIAYV